MRVSLNTKPNTYQQKTIQPGHRGPRNLLHIPHQQISTYQKQYIRYPINTWQRPKPQKAQQYRPYDYINSKYRQDYPGHKPQMRQKIVPRVKNQSRNLPFDSSSEYKNQFGQKRSTLQKPFIKDNQFNPDNQQFINSTTYGSFFTKKARNPHQRAQSSQVRFPPGYKFNPNTTYNKDFVQKTPNINKSYRPIEYIGQKGPHDLNTIYRKDYIQKFAGLYPKP